MTTARTYDSPRSGLQSLARELRVAVRMIPRMYFVPLRHVWRQVVDRLG